jgi:hypothetical protein
MQRNQEKENEKSDHSQPGNRERRWSSLLANGK